MPVCPYSATELILTILTLNIYFAQNTDMRTYIEIFRKSTLLPNHKYILNSVQNAILDFDETIW